MARRPPRAYPLIVEYIIREPGLFTQSGAMPRHVEGSKVILVAYLSLYGLSRWSRSSRQGSSCRSYRPQQRRGVRPLGVVERFIVPVLRRKGAKGSNDNTGGLFAARKIGWEWKGKRMERSGEALRAARCFFPTKSRFFPVPRPLRRCSKRLFLPHRNEK